MIWSIVQIPFQTRWQRNFSNARGILPFPCGSFGKASGFALARTAESLHSLYQIAGHTIGMPRNLAQREGFEPPEALTSIVFKTTAIDHSAISANKLFDFRVQIRPCQSHFLLCLYYTTPYINFQAFIGGYG